MNSLKARALFLALGFVGASLAMFATAGPADACVCAPGSLEQAVADSATAFAGKVGSVKETTAGQVSRIVVTRVFKGSVLARTDVVDISPGSCGGNLQTGDRVLAFTYTYAGSSLNLDPCATLVGGTGQQSVAKAVSRLGPGTDAQDGLLAWQPPEAPESGGPSYWPVVSAAAVGVAVVALLVARSRRWWRAGRST